MCVGGGGGSFNGKIIGLGLNFMYKIFFLSLQDLTILSMEFFRWRKIHILSVINLLTKSPTEMIHR